MARDQITDHSDQAILRLSSFEVEGPNWNKLIRALTGSVQNLETALTQLLDERAISTGVGVQLDGIGTILDVTRITGQSDSDYAAALIGKAAALSAASGTAEQLIQTYLLLLAANTIVSMDLQPATFEMTAVGTEDDGNPTDAVVVAAMREAKAAGVQLILQICIEPCFLWGAEADADANGDIPANTTGFGDDADADGNGDILPGVGGGNLARVL